MQKSVNIFNSHKSELDKVQPSDWPRGFGQLALGHATFKLCHSGAKVINLEKLAQKINPSISSLISKNYDSRHPIIIGNSNNGRRRKINTSKDFLRILQNKNANNEILSRKNPSYIYHELVKNYSLMHSSADSNSAKPKFPGKKVCEMAALIQRVALINNCKSVLDYGGGKGFQYTDKVIFIDIDTGKTYKGLHNLLGAETAFVFDPSSSNLKNKPDPEDLVICTDVLEHIYENDLPWVLHEIFSSAKKTVFLTIACYLDRKKLPNGLPCHITVKEPNWWHGLVKGIGSQYPHISYVCVCWQMSKEGFIPKYDSNITKLERKDSYFCKLSDFGILNRYKILFGGKELTVARKLI